jgi:hypothetical protein
MSGANRASQSRTASDVVLLVVRWRLRYKLSLRDLAHEKLDSHEAVAARLTYASAAWRLRPERAAGSASDIPRGRVEMPRRPTAVPRRRLKRPPGNHQFGAAKGIL